VDVGIECKISRRALRAAVSDPIMAIRVTRHLPLQHRSQEMEWVVALNPMTGIIEAFRSSLLGREFDWALLAISAGMTLVCCSAQLCISAR